MRLKENYTLKKKKKENIILSDIIKNRIKKNKVIYEKINASINDYNFKINGHLIGMTKFYFRVQPMKCPIMLNKLDKVGAKLLSMKINNLFNFPDDDGLIAKKKNFKYFCKRGI